MKSYCLVVLTACAAILPSACALAATNPLAGEWIIMKNSDRTPPDLTTADQPALENGETKKIEALLKHLETLKEATFIRNDEALPPEEAATLMRSKWKAQGKDIKTATEFIEKIMTSSSSGSRKPYLLRFKDGKETKCADYLKAELKKLETKPK